jgi:hypothetical protein
MADLDVALRAAFEDRIAPTRTAEVRRPPPFCNASLP